MWKVEKVNFYTFPLSITLWRTKSGIWKKNDRRDLTAAMTQEWASWSLTGYYWVTCIIIIDGNRERNSLNVKLDSLDWLHEFVDGFSSLLSIIQFVASLTWPERTRERERNISNWMSFLMLYFFEKNEAKRDVTWMSWFHRLFFHLQEYRSKGVNEWNTWIALMAIIEQLHHRHLSMEGDKEEEEGKEREWEMKVTFMTRFKHPFHVIVSHSASLSPSSSFSRPKRSVSLVSCDPSNGIEVMPSKKQQRCWLHHQLEKWNESCDHDSLVILSSHHCISLIIFLFFLLYEKYSIV